MPLFFSKKADQAQPEPGIAPLGADGADTDRTDPLAPAGQPAEIAEEWLAGAGGRLEAVTIHGAAVSSTFLRLTLNDPAPAAAAREALLSLPEAATGFRDLLVSEQAVLCAALDPPETTLGAWVHGTAGGYYLRPLHLLEGIANTAQVLAQVHARSGLVWPAPAPEWLGLYSAGQGQGPGAVQRLLRFLAWPELTAGEVHQAAVDLVQLALAVWRRFIAMCGQNGFNSSLASLRHWEQQLQTLAADPLLDYAVLSNKLQPAAAAYLLHGATDPGMRREHNEDAYLLSQLDQHSSSGSRLTLAAVADGMGGHASGEIASSLALDLLRQQLAQLLVPPRTTLCDPQALPVELGRLLPAIDTALTERAKLDPVLSGMGTTMCGFAQLTVQSTLVSPDSPMPSRGVVFWVGDSRAYVLGPCGLAALSVDHSYVQELVQAGEIPAEAAFDHPNKNVITRCLGGNGGGSTPDMVDFTPGPGELLLICSDGLSDALRDGQIWECACRSGDGALSQLSRALIAAANAAGGPDNITVVCCALLTTI